MYLVYYRVQFFLWSEGEAMQKRLSKGSAWWFLAGLGVVDSTDARLIVSAIGIFSVANNDTRVQERAADGPKHGRHLAWW
jgi:hypothetical protein